MTRASKASPTGSQGSATVWAVTGRRILWLAPCIRPAVLPDPGESLRGLALVSDALWLGPTLTTHRHHQRQVPYKLPVTLPPRQVSYNSGAAVVAKPLVSGGGSKRKCTRIIYREISPDHNPLHTVGRVKGCRWVYERVVPHGQNKSLVAAGLYSGWSWGCKGDVTGTLGGVVSRSVH